MRKPDAFDIFNLIKGYLVRKRTILNKKAQKDVSNDTEQIKGLENGMNENALNAQEVADILQIAKNTVYELVKRGELSCYKVGRKMRFTYSDIQEYINGGKTGANRSAVNSAPGAGTYASAGGAAKPRLISKNDTPEENAYSGRVSGSADGAAGIFRIAGQDEILDALLRHMELRMPGVRTELIHKGSYDAFSMLYKDQVSAAAGHMWDSETDVYNVPFVKRLLPGCPAVIVEVCKRTQGFYVAEGNPKKIKDWEDLKRNDIRLANREPGAGTRILLDEHLVRLGIDADKIPGYGTHLSSHFNVAGAVSKGEADVGIGTMKTALGIRGVSFIPLQTEDYQLVFKRRDMNSPYVQLILQILNSEDLKEEFRYVAGYDVSEMGKIIQQ